MRSLSDGAKATVLGAFVEGWRRVLRAPALVLAVLAMTFVAALPSAVVLRGMLADHLGQSLTAERALGQWDAEWTTEFAAQARDVGRTFTYEILGFGGTIAAIGGLLDGQGPPPSLRVAIAIYLVAWVLLSGGLLDRLARGRALRPFAFFAACGGHAGRLFRLALVTGAGYYAIFRWLHPLLFSVAPAWLTSEGSSETTRLAVQAGLYVVLVAALALVNVVSDYAKVRLVVEDRRSALAGLAASWRFIRRRPGRVAGLYVLNVMALLIVLRLWMQIAPSATSASWVALLAVQVSLLARLWTRLAFLASQIVFFQGELAHASYAAAPRPVWPDAAAVEAVARLKR